MALTLTNAYCTEAQIKAALGVVDTDDDAALSDAVNAASRLIDRHCGQRFWVDPSDVTRYYTADDWRLLAVTGSHPNDCGVTSITSVSIDWDGDNTYGDTYVEGEAFIATPQAAATNGEPYTHLQILLDNRGWPVGVPEGVKVVGTFGWPAVPDEVVEATILQATEVFKAVREAPMGVVTGFGGGFAPRLTSGLNRKAAALLEPYRRHGGFA